MDKKKKVLHLIDSLDLGGAQTILAFIAKYQDVADYEFHFYSLHGPGAMQDRISASTQNVGSIASRKYSPALPLQFIRTINRIKPDIVHAHLVVSCFLADMMRQKFFKRNSYLLVEHVHNQYRAPSRVEKYQNYLEKFLYRNNELTIPCSKGLGESLRDALGSGHAPIQSLPNAIDDTLIEKKSPEKNAELRIKHNVSQNKILFISACRLVPQKNLFYAVDIFEELNHLHPNTEYWIIGKGNLQDSLLSHVEEKNLQGRVKFMGYRDDANDLFAMADFYLQPSLDEGLSIALLESMAKQVVPIVTPYMDYDEIIADGENGIVVPFDDAAAAAQRIGSIVNSENATEELGCAALNSVQNEYSASQMVRRLQSIYDDLLAQSK